MKIWKMIALLCTVSMLLAGCHVRVAVTTMDDPAESAATETTVAETTAEETTAETAMEESSVTETEEQETSAPETEPATESVPETESVAPTTEAPTTEAPTTEAAKTESTGRGVVCIDPGHQAKQNKDKEPVGPGSKEMKQKVSSGTTGKWSGLEEYQLNLDVSLKLQKILEERGYQVILTRTTNDVDMSNAERAEIANKAKADVFIRIHADGDDNEKYHGIMTISPTTKNPYMSKDLSKKSFLLADYVLEAMVENTGARNRLVWDTDTMSGINWSQVPVTIVEMGYMTNKDEDTKMATEEYQMKLAEGMANGIDRYMDKQKG